MHRTGTKHIVRHMQKSVIQWSVISKFTCTGFCEENSPFRYFPNNALLKILLRTMMGTSSKHNWDNLNSIASRAPAFSTINSRFVTKFQFLKKSFIIRLSIHSLAPSLRLHTWCQWVHGILVCHEISIPKKKKLSDFASTPWLHLSGILSDANECMAYWFVTKFQFLKINITRRSIHSLAPSLRHPKWCQWVYSMVYCMLLSSYVASHLRTSVFLRRGRTICSHTFPLMKH